MTIPNRVKQQAERAAQLIAENTASGQETTPSDDETRSGTPEEIISNAEENLELTPKPKEEEFTPLEKPKDDGDVDAATWKQRYSALLGKYNAEVPRLRAEIKELKASEGGASQSEVEDLKAQVTNLKAQLEQSREAEQKTAQELSDREKQVRENYGDELVDFQKDSAAQLQEQVTELTNKLSESETRALVAERKGLMRGRLSPKGVDFDQRNEDEGFLDFIASYGEAGRTYSSILPEAFSKGDLDTVERIFLAYEPPSQSNETAQTSMERHVQVAPTSGAPEAAAEEDVWTRPQIKQFYADKNAGRLSPEEAERYQKSLDAFLARSA